MDDIWDLIGSVSESYLLRGLGSHDKINIVEFIPSCRGRTMLVANSFISQKIMPHLCVNNIY